MGSAKAHIIADEIMYPSGRLRHAIFFLFKASTGNLFVQLFRYAFVGGASFIVDFGLLFVLTDACNLYYLLSATISFIAGLVTNYLLGTAWIFKHSKIQNRSLEFFLYAIVGVVGLLLNNALLYVFTTMLGIYYLVSKLITAAIVMLWNFFGRRLLYKNK